jgi:nucleoside-diphosphate-sugar epimerase
MRVLLVGGAGFMGAPTARLLHQAGHTVALLHTGAHEPPLPAEIVHMHNKNVRPHIKAFPRQAIDFAPEVVVHFLLLDDGDAQACLEHFTGVARRVVMLSSGDVYRAYGQLLGHEAGDGTTTELLDETAPLRDQLYPYGKRLQGPWGTIIDYDKILAERAIVGEPRLPATILRLPRVYGPGDRQRTFGRWVEHLRAHDEIPVGERQGRWRWTHGFVDDVVQAIVCATVDERAAGRVYNVGEAVTPTQRQRVTELAEAMSWCGRIINVSDAELPAALRDGHGGAPDLAYDTRRIRDQLGWTETTDYRAALRATVALF